MWYLAVKLTVPGVESPIILALITLSITFLCVPTWYLVLLKYYVVTSTPDLCLKAHGEEDISEDKKVSNICRNVYPL